ncbi:MAG: type II secretion system F family protein [Novosphingobium sp.]
MSEISLVRLGILALFFGLCAWASYRFLLVAQSSATVRTRVKAVGSVRPSLSAEKPGGAGAVWGRLVEVVERSGLSLSDSDPDALRAKMIAAGFDSPIAPRAYVLIRLVMVFAVPALGLLVLAIAGLEFNLVNLYFVGIISAALALLGPTYFIRARTSSRKTAITNGFPNCLDLLLVCVEAGLGLEAALDRISREMAEAEPEVSRLLVRTTLHLRAGASREEALRRLSDLAGVDEISSFCTMLIQSERLGSSIGTTLRIFASEMREKRRMRAEEKAHKLPVLISVPLIVCMLPTMLGVLMLPAAIRVATQLLPALAGK